MPVWSSFPPHRHTSLLSTQTTSTMEASRNKNESEDGSMQLDVNFDRVEDITLEDAIAEAQDVEDALLETANGADKDILKYVLRMFPCACPLEESRRFSSSHNLSDDRALWAYQTCTRLRFKNKKYRAKTKQALADQAQELKILHTECGMRMNAYRHITALVDLAVSECRAAYHYHEQVCQPLLWST